MVSSAFATTIDLSAYESAGTGVNYPTYPSDAVTTDGFTLTDNPNYSGVWQTGGLGYSGEAMMFADSPNDTITLTASDASPFSIQSIDLDTSFNNSGPSPVAFVGNVHGGGTVTAGITLTSAGITTFSFDGTFTNLDSLTWTQTDGYNQFGNIVVNEATAPEPASFLLLGAGVCGLLLQRRRSVRG